jgi:hypothetical protein
MRDPAAFSRTYSAFGLEREPNERFSPISPIDNRIGQYRPTYADFADTDP